MLRALVLPMMLVAVMPGAALCQIQGQLGATARRGVNGGQNSSLSTSSTSGTTEPFELTGHVINARTNAPIARALVKLGPRAVLTNHDGVFTFPQVTSTTGLLVPSKEGFYPSPTGNDVYLHSVPLAAGTPVDLMLYPEVVITGTVVGPTGEGLPNFMVTIRRSTFDEYGHHWTPTGIARTDAAGVYRTVVPPGDYALQTRNFGRARGETEVYLPASVPADVHAFADALHVKMGDQVQVNLRPEVRRGYQVSIRGDAGEERGIPMLVAYSASGAPIPLSPMPDRGEPGSFRVVLPNGTYHLTGTMGARGGRVEAEAQVTVAGRDVEGVVLHFSKTPQLPVEVSVEPNVSTANLTVPGAQSLGMMLVANSSNLDGLEQTYLLTTAQDKTTSFEVPNGRYQFQCRSMGQWYITSADYGGSNLLTDELVTGLGSGAQTIRVRISNQVGTVSGTVSLDGQPAQAFIYLVAKGPSAHPVRLIRSNTDGSFNQSNVPPGSYRVLAVQQKLLADPRDPATLTRFLGKVQDISLDASGTRTMTLEAVPSTEMPQ